MTFAFWVLEILGTTARSSYMQADTRMIMPSSTEVEGGGVGAATVQNAVGGRSDR